ncbi:MAG: hypothetical protein ACXAC8_07885 [Candidatus Hodarchaeales archaeon]
MKRIQDDTAKDVQEHMKKKLTSMSTTKYLPEDMITYLLSLKSELLLPASILPSSLFKKPIFFGREKFFHRLASELVSFGLSYQRVYLIPISFGELTTLFMEQRTGWQCEEKDIKKALNFLIQKQIIQEKKEGYLFEPLKISTDVREFLAFIAEDINEYGEISLSQVQNNVPWDISKIDTMIKLLETNQIIIFNQSKKLLYFPELRNNE